MPSMPRASSQPPEHVPPYLRNATKPLFPPAQTQFNQAIGEIETVRAISLPCHNAFLAQSTAVARRFLQSGRSVAILTNLISENDSYSARDEPSIVNLPPDVVSTVTCLTRTIEIEVISSLVDEKDTIRWTNRHPASQVIVIDHKLVIAGTLAGMCGSVLAEHHVFFAVVELVKQMVQKVFRVAWERLYRSSRREVRQEALADLGDRYVEAMFGGRISRVLVRLEENIYMHEGQISGLQLSFDTVRGPCTTTIEMEAIQAIVTGIAGWEQSLPFEKGLPLRPLRPIQSVSGVRGTNSLGPSNGRIVKTIGCSYGHEGWGPLAQREREQMYERTGELRALPTRSPHDVSSNKYMRPRGRRIDNNCIDDREERNQ